MFARTTTPLLTLGLLLALTAATFATEPVKVTNQSGKTVRVKVWCGLAKKTVTLENGASFSWNRKNTKSYNVRVQRKEGRVVKVWKTKSTRKGLDYSSDVIIKSGYKISATRPRHTVFHNDSDVAIVVRTYNSKDGVRLIGGKSFTIQAGKSATWRTAKDRFHIKVFELRDGFNRHLSTRTDIPRPADVTISNRNGWQVSVKRK
jgi:hypothetical protein